MKPLADSIVEQVSTLFLAEEEQMPSIPQSCLGCITFDYTFESTVHGGPDPQVSQWLASERGFRRSFEEHKVDEAEDGRVVTFVSRRATGFQCPRDVHESSVKVGQRELLQKDETLLKMQADLAFLFLMMVVLTLVKRKDGDGLMAF